VAKSSQVGFATLSDAEKQAWVDFSLKEIHRHQEDIDRVRAELEHIRNKYGIVPRSIYVGTWLEVY
jgi:poly(3-hydroxybutyrate) depolymerase